MAPYADLIFDPHALDESAIQETRALEDFREGYGAAAGHKAFAQSGLGAWVWTSGRTSSEHAVRSALKKCRRITGAMRPSFRAASSMLMDAGRANENRPAARAPSGLARCAASGVAGRQLDIG